MTALLVEIQRASISRREVVNPKHEISVSAIYAFERYKSRVIIDHRCCWTLRWVTIIKSDANHSIDANVSFVRRNTCLNGLD